MRIVFGLLTSLGVLLAGPAMPQEAPAFSTRVGDMPFDEARLNSDVVGATHEFFDGGRSFFSISGSYSYTYPDGGIAYGTYELRDQGVVCTFFRHGFERCDLYVENAGRVVLINAAGDRFPVRDLS
ncbi:MAG: hypothetical protein AAGD04_13045 [Pseudomonadota bacterium]